MGNFETYTYSAGAWSGSARVEPWLSIALHDSSFASVEFAPSEAGRGLLYLGFQPRDYFADPTASADVDNAAEAIALARWAKVAVGNLVDPGRIVPLIAAEGVEEPVDVFVEETIERLLAVLGLPLPDDLVA